MNGFKKICAALVGMVFFAAGILKLMDPLGTGLIVQEYLKFFHLTFLSGLATASGLAVSLFETILGAALICGIRRRAVAKISLVILLIFSVITAILWIAGAQMDCGCFGNFVQLKPWQSFVKNLVLLGLWSLAFLPMKDLGEPRKAKYAAFAIGAVSVALFGLYSALSLPLVDFGTYKPGTELLGASDENFDDITGAVYSKNGREGVFTPDCPPDSTWKFVRYETYDRGFIDSDAPRPLLSFYDASGAYADSLALSGKVMLVSAYAPEKLSAARLKKISGFASAAQKNGFTLLFLVAGSPETSAINEPALAAGTYFADRLALLNLNRSNGGVTFVSDGLICDKWSARALPKDEHLASLAQKDPVEYMGAQSRKGKVRLQAFLLYTFAAMLLL